MLRYNFHPRSRLNEKNSKFFARAYDGMIEKRSAELIMYVIEYQCYFLELENSKLEMIFPLQYTQHIFNAMKSYWIT